MRDLSSHPAARAPRRPRQRPFFFGTLTALVLLELGSAAHAGGSAPVTAGAHLAAPRSVQARPSLPPPEPFKPPRWQRHVEIGGEAALVMRTASSDAQGQPSEIRYAPAVGYGFHARIELYRYLRFSAWFLRSEHELRLVPPAFGQAGDFVVSPSTVPPLETMVLGVSLAPTLPLTGRARSWLTLGVGWGRLHLGRVQPLTGPSIRERSATFVEFPLGLGTSFEIIPRWLSIEVETTGSFIVRQSGEVLESAQAIDAEGRRRQIRPLPLIDASFVQTLGLSIVL